MVQDSNSASVPSQVSVQEQPTPEAGAKQRWIKNGRVARCLTLIAGAIGLACALGICLDLVTANVAVEYFSVHHPRLIPSENPWLLALAWGIAASWWFGALAGGVLAVANETRKRPLQARPILRWGAVACLVLWFLMIGVLLAVYGIAGTIPEEERRPSFNHDRRIMAVAVAHQYEYVFGAVAAAVSVVKVRRAKM